MPYIDIIGWIATAILASKAIPQLLKCRRRGNAKGISFSFLWMWLSGHFLMLAYLILQPTLIVPLIVYSCFNITIVGMILRYRYFPRKKDVRNEIELNEMELH